MKRTSCSVISILCVALVPLVSWGETQSTSQPSTQPAPGYEGAPAYPGPGAYGGFPGGYGPPGFGEYPGAYSGPGYSGYPGQAWGGPGYSGRSSYQGVGGIQVRSGSTPEGYHIWVIPGRGIKPEDILVDLDRGSLLLRTAQGGGTETSQHYPTPGYSYSYRSGYRHFQRRVSLPRDVDINGMSIKSENGVLSIFLPRIAGPVTGGGPGGSGQ
jgi:hypothetical protein